MGVIEGTVRAGEAATSAGAVRNRQYGPPVYLAGALLIPVGGCLGGLIETILTSDPKVTGAGEAIGILVGGLAGLVLMRRLLRAQFVRRLKQKGLAETYSFRLEFGEQLIHQLGAMTQIFEWSGVTELFRARRYWVIIAQTQPIYVPRRVFVTPAAEAAFLSEVLDRMPTAARLRSRHAEKARLGLQRP